MTWALLAAGARSVGASWWKVDSAASEELMIAFHRELAKGVPAADALRSASLKLMRDAERRHPYYWASFSLIGDGW